MPAQPELALDEHLLARFVPMSALDAPHLRDLCNHAALVELAAGQSLTEELGRLECIYYVVDGELRLRGGDEPDETVRAGEAGARFALPALEAPGRTATAACPTRLLRVDRAKISTLLIWSQTAREHEQGPNRPVLEAEIATLLLESKLFANIPPSNIERLVELTEPVRMAAGDVVVRQGDPGDYYYIVQRGRCEVLREPESGGESIRLATLGDGESFGEEALLTGAQRNATVRMLTDGVLLRLTREYFVDLVSKPLLREVTLERAEDLVAAGAVWIDVRVPEEFQRDGLEGAVNIPLSELRQRTRELSRQASYVTYCNTGRRSQAAAFLLSQRGIRACCLRDGILRGRPTPPGERAGSLPLAGLQAELMRVNAALDEALHRKAEAEAAREVQEQALRDGGRGAEASARVQHLEEQALRASEALRAAMLTKRELEEKVREAEAEEATRRRAAEAECERLRHEAQSRLEQEKSRLAEHYREASVRLRDIEDARRDAETHFDAERRRIEQELAEARARMEAEAARVRKALEAAHREAETRAQAIRNEHVGREQKLRQETEEALRLERARLEKEFAESVTAQEQARRELELAEAARREAEEETDRMRSAAEREERERRDREAARREEEIRALREESERAAARLQEALAAREAVEERRREVSDSIASLGRSADTIVEEKLRAELRSFESEVASAEDAVSAAARAHASAEAAQNIAEQTAAATRAREEELRLQLYEEMETWVAEEEERSREELERTERYAREFERLQAEKEAKRRAAEAATASMFSDIQNVLSGDDAGPLDSYVHARLVAEEKARLVQRARREAAQQTAQARIAASRAQEDDSTGE